MPALHSQALTQRFFSLGTELWETHRGIQAATSLSGLLFELRGHAVKQRSMLSHLAEK